VGFTCDVVACVMYDAFFKDLFPFQLSKTSVFEEDYISKRTIGFAENRRQLCVKNTDLAESDGINITKSVQETQISLTPYEKISPIWIGLMIG